MTDRFRLGRLALPLLVTVALGLPTGFARGATELRLGTVAPEGSRYGKDLREFGREIEHVTDGDVSIRWFMAARLGDEKVMGAMLGGADPRLEGAGFTGIGLTFLVPEMRVWLFPGMFQNYAEVDYLEGRYREEFVKAFEKAGLVMVLWDDVGFTHIHSGEPIDTWAELKKHQMWLWSDDETTLSAAALVGISTVATPLGKLPDWLRERKIDVWAYPPLGVVAMGLEIYSRYVSDMPFTFLAGAVVIRKDVWDTLSPSTQRGILAVGKKWEARLIKSWRAENQRALEALVKQGTHLVTWKSEDRQRFFQATSEHRDEFGKKWGIEPLMHRFSEDLEHFRASNR